MPPVDDDAFSDDGSQYSRSSAGMSSVLSASHPGRLVPSRRCLQPALAAAGSAGDLFARLEAAERQLKARKAESCSSRSSHSEERDTVLVGERVVDELEKRSSASGGSGSGSAARGQAGRGGGAGAGLKTASKSSAKGSAGGAAQSMSSGSGSRAQRSEGNSSSSARKQPKTQLEQAWEDTDIANEKVQALEEKVEEQEVAARVSAQELADSSEARREDAAAKVELRVDVKNLEVKRDDLQEKLKNAKAEKAAIKEDRDNLADAVEALKARHMVEMQKVKQGHIVQMAVRDQEEEAANVSEAAAKVKNDILVKKLRDSEREKDKALKEADVLRVKEAMARAENTAKTAKVEAMWAAASEDAMKTQAWAAVAELELQLRDQVADVQSKKKALNAKDAGQEAELENPKQPLGSATMVCSSLRAGRACSHTSNPGSASASSTSSWHPASPIQPTPVARQPTLNIANGARTYGSVLSRAPLATIFEGDDLMSGDGSITGGGGGSDVSGGCATGHGGQFSSNGDETVGDMHDFDEAVEDPLSIIRRTKIDVSAAIREPINTANKAIRLKASAEKAAERAVKEKDELVLELAAKRQEKQDLREQVLAQEIRERLLQEELAANQAADESKIQRLQQQLSMRHSEQEEMDERILELKQSVEAKEVRLEAVRDRLDVVWMRAESREENLQHVRQELEEKKGKTEELNRWAYGMQEQLEQAWEAKRLAEARCDDLKMALEGEETRNAKLVEELRHEIRILKLGGGGGNDGGGAPGSELSDLRGELEAAWAEVKRLEEDRNMLVNVLEWKEVQFRNTIEDMEQQFAAAHAQAARQIREEVEQGKGDLLSVLDAQAEALRQRFACSNSVSTYEPTSKWLQAGPDFGNHLEPGMDGDKPVRSETVSEASSRPSAGELGGS